MKIAIVGSGYVGLVASACFAELGHDVICVDNDPEKLAALVRGETPIHEQYLPELLGRHRGQRLKFSASLPDAVRASSVVREAKYLARSEEHTSELQSLRHLVCRLLLEKKNKVVSK